MQCPNCQHVVRPGQPFCDHCGRDLSDLQTATTSAPLDQTNTPGSAYANLPPQPIATQAQLVIGDGSASYDLPAGDEVLIGHVDPIDGIYPDIDLTPHDPAAGVSRRHAIVHEQGGQWFLTDQHSTNYTVVNRQRLTPDQDYLLDDGDEIRFGQRQSARFHRS